MIRVVFVDDEPAVLDGLRRSLRRLRDEWDMEFVEGAREAIACLEARPADVLVSDMRMPGMDGAELLVEVHRRWPSTVRFILSGYVEMEGILRTLPVAHQFLSKPCDPKAIRAAIERAMRLQRTLSNDAISAWIGAIDSLPSLPSMYTAVLEAIRDPEVGITAVAQQIERDSSVAAKVLQIVNSSFFGLAQEVTSVAQAVGLLGVQQLRDLVLTIEVFRPSEGMDADVVAFLEGIQRHSSRVATAAKLLQPDKAQGDLTFTAGLLHEVGCKIFASREPERFGERIREARASGRPLRDLEIEEWGVDHAAVGAALLAYWGLPYPIIEAVAYHQRPSEIDSDEATPLTYVHVASALSAGPEEDASINLQHPHLDLEHIARLGLEESIEDWTRLIQEHFNGD